MPQWPTADEVATRLRSTGSVFADDEARLLIADAASPQQLDAWVDQRMSGSPLEQILGWAEFCGLRIVVEPGVFVPRQRTAFMVHLAAALATGGDVAVDLCCGSGAVGAALSTTAPGIRVFAADVDPAAVHCARRNLPPDQVFDGDLFDALPPELKGTIRILLANAPYVPTEAIGLMPPEARLHEAHVALDGGVDGLQVQRRIIAAAPAWLAPGGTLLVETSGAQAARTAELFSRAGLVASVRHSDDLDSTIVIGTLPLQ